MEIWRRKALLYTHSISLISMHEYYILVHSDLDYHIGNTQQVFLERGLSESFSATGNWDIPLWTRQSHMYFAFVREYLLFSSVHSFSKLSRYL